MKPSTKAANAKFRAGRRIEILYWLLRGAAFRGDKNEVSHYQAEIAAENRRLDDPQY